MSDCSFSFRNTEVLKSITHGAVKAPRSLRSCCSVLSCETVCAVGGPDAWWLANSEPNPQT